MPAIRISEFDTWRSGYGLATVRVLVAGSSTLAMLYSDEALTQQVDNPQTLSERILGGISYGKFAGPRYTSSPYELDINSVDRTGVQRPAISQLAGEDASGALATVTGGAKSFILADLFARRIDVRDYGDFIAAGEEGASASSNTATLTTAIGAAAALGGGFVELPGGTYQLNAFSVSQGVVLRGVGREGTILQSTLGGKVATIGGERAGFSRLTLDGVTLPNGSVGVYAHDKDAIVFDDVEIKRFQTGLQCDGGEQSRWFDLYIKNCVTGYRCHGDDDEDPASVRQFNVWTGGRVETCSGVGIELRHDGSVCTHNYFHDVGFLLNTGTAVHIIGARATAFRECWWLDNTVNIEVEDGTPETSENTVIGLEISDGSIEDGEINLSDTVEAVAFRRMTFKDVEIALTMPEHGVLAEDCREISGVTFTGTGTAWLRKKTGDRGTSAGLTTGNAATKAWGIALDPGQRVYLEGKVIGRQRNGTGDAFYHIAVSARRPGASLAYDTQTANFTVGNVLVGATTGATGRITADSDGGTTGTLTLQDVVGEFLDNEIITDGAGGSATANGGLSFSNAELAGTVTAIRPAQETVAGWDATFVANGPEIELRVTGAASTTIEWSTDVDVVSH